MIGQSCFLSSDPHSFLQKIVVSNICGHVNCRMVSLAHTCQDLKFVILKILTLALECHQPAKEGNSHVDLTIHCVKCCLKVEFSFERRAH